VEIVITGRHTDVSERFRRTAEEKLTKVTQFAPRASRVDLELSHEPNPRQAQASKKVEITVRDRGPVIRAEAVADEPYSALDIAMDKLIERLRRSRDRRKIHHGRQTPRSVRTAEPLATAPPAVQDGVTEEAEPPEEYTSPVVIRTKDHVAAPMSLDQALYEMELVGHDFFLFVDAETRRPSVVYRRKGWNYGVIRLEVADPSAQDAPAEASVG
jgi:ribosomal subunit interface protein